MATLHLVSAPQPIDDFDGWLASFTQPTVAFEVLALVVSAVLAWALVAGLRRKLDIDDERSVWFGKRTVDGVLFPLALLVFGYLSLELLSRFVNIAVLRIAVPVLMSLLVIRVGVKVLQATFAEARWVKPLEQTISWGAWLAMVLWVSGLLPVILNEMDLVTWKVGGTNLSLRNMLEGLVTASAVLIITLWISSGIESRLLRSAKGAELSLRKAVSNASRALLMFVGLMFAMSAVGIDLTALSVLGGAVGVGIGFGLQKLAANYVSGFVILAERSMRIGDMVRVDNFEGVITEINARYTVVRSPTGRESIVPNEILITSRVENWSLADPRVYQSIAVAVGYDSDVAQVMGILVQSALAQPRVLRDPGPAALLANFGADGLEFTLGYWIEDIENGQGNLRSDINQQILRELRAHGIDIPYPQRVVHTRSPT
jgi:small-conductance mechanosensitive channel